MSSNKTTASDDSPADWRQKSVRPPVSKTNTRGAAIAQWIRLRLPSCRPGFESQAHHQCFYQYIFVLCHVEKTKVNKMRPGLAHFFKKILCRAEGGSLGLVVMGVDSCSEGCGIESQHRMLAGYFIALFCFKNCNVDLKR